MRWKKKLLLPLLVASFSLLLLVFGCEKQANAIVSRNITQLNISGNTINYDTAGNIFNYTLSQVGATTNSTQLNNTIGFTFNNNLSSNNENGILIEMWARVSVSDSSSKHSNLYVVPVCPSENPDMYQGNYSVTDCEVEFLDFESYVQEYHELYWNGGTDIDSDPDLYGENYFTRDYFLHYKMYAYSNTEQTVSSRSFNLYGGFMRFYDTGKRLAETRVQILTNFATDSQPINRKTAEEEMNDKDDQDRADLENQSSETDSDANSAGADASNTGTSLLGVFSAFVSALSTIHETDCRLPSMSVYGLQLGQMDLCTFDVPPGIIALATVGMVFIIVPLSFHLARRLVNIFRSFQG